MATDLSHIATPAQVAGFLPPDNGAEKALKGADIVVIPAGVPRKPGMTRDDLFVSRFDRYCLPETDMSFTLRT